MPEMDTGSKTASSVLLGSAWSRTGNGAEGNIVSFSLFTEWNPAGEEKEEKET